MSKKIKLTDYLANFFEKKGIKNIFGVTGGANLHIIDSLKKNKKLKLIFNHHEQASAFSAQASSRVNNTPSVCIVTTGPGGTNSLTGVLSAWQDSIPCIFISGQSRSQIIKNTFKRRQFGAQGFDITNFIKPITKRAITILDPKNFPDILEECYQECKSGRPGPIWIDIPLDIQMSLINNKNVISKDKKLSKTINNFSKNDKNKIIALIKKSKRPVIVAGNGINTSGSKSKFIHFVNKLKIPVLFTWNASDILSYSNSMNFGRPGMFGQRGANIILQNSDLILALGTTLSLSVTTPNYKNFAPKAKIIHIDYDNSELDHFKKKISFKKKIDLRSFFKIINKTKIILKPNLLWIKFCLNIKNNFNKVYIKKLKRFIDPYEFLEFFSDKIDKGDSIVIDGGGTCNQIFFQTFKNKINQRIYISGGVCAMGSGLPDSIGISSTSKSKNIYLICGDGSFQLNVQELQTIIENNLKIKIFIFSNGNYTSIKHTQKEFLNKHYVGSCKSGGLSFPKIKDLASTYKIKYFKYNNIKKLLKNFNKIKLLKKSAITEIVMHPSYEIRPRLTMIKDKNGKYSAATIADMYPFLKRKELLKLISSIDD